MKRILFSLFLLVCMISVYSQTTYYWVGGTGPVAFSTNSNWNTSLDGSGTTRAAADPADILIFNGTNVGGTAPATGTVTATMTSVTTGQLKLVSNASVVFTRVGTGTGVLTISGSGTGDDFIVENGSNLSLNSTLANGSVQMLMPAGVTGRITGALSLTNTGQQRITQGTTTAAAGSLVFANGSSFTSNITSTSSSYPFGSNTQSSEKWVVFEPGANLYYEGGWSPMGNNSLFAAIDFKPGSTWFHRATNIIPSVFGSFFNTKSFGNIIVENNASLASDGPIYRIGNLTVNTGSNFTTHTSGQTVVLGNLNINGNLLAPAGSTNTLVLGGNAQQNISGTGTIVIPNLVIADNSDVVMNKNIVVSVSANQFGKLNFTTTQLSGTASYSSRVNNSATFVTGNLVAGSYQVGGVVGTLANLNGLTITGAGIPANTSVVGFSSGGATINLSQPITTSGSSVAINFTSDTAIIATANTSGFDSTNGSVVVTGNKSFQNGTSYIINAPTTWPIGITSGSGNTTIQLAFLEVNAPVTVNRSFDVFHHLTVNAKLTLRPLDLAHIIPGAVIDGNFGNSAYIATLSNSVSGDQGIVQFDGLAPSTIIPIGTANYYLPVTLTPPSPSGFSVSVFEGITSNGMVTGTPLTPAQKQNVVNAVWNIVQISGGGNTGIQFNWDAALEGSTFTSLPNTDIGIIQNTGSSYSLPIGTGNNTTNTASAFTTISGLGAFSIGSIPLVQPFIFNALPVKTYGDPDFNGGATSLNTTQPITYTSSNPAVATIVSGNIHITGAGTTTITASQPGDGFYSSASVSRTLTVNKASLTITGDNKLKFEGEALPVLTVTYSGFVYGETSAALTTPVTISTTATAASLPGTYPITVTSAASANYNITFVPGILTVQAKQNQTITFAALATKTYGNADFAAGATSTNTTLPVTYTSSNSSVATIVGNNIHIVGAGTATITASQAGNPGYFPAQDVSRLLTVNKGNLTIRVRDTTKTQGDPNPSFTLTAIGFVLNETLANLGTQPTVSTIATEISAPGYYTLTPGGAVSTNYNITYVTGRLTVLPPGGINEKYLNVFMNGRNNLTVRVYVPEPALADIMIYDFLGKPFMKRNVFLPVGFISFDLNVGTVPAGIYIIRVEGSGLDLKKRIFLGR